MSLKCINGYMPGCIYCRQFNAALQDLIEALKLAPDNRELRRLLQRVKEECHEQSKLDHAPSITSVNEIMERMDVPDIVPTMSNNKALALQERTQSEETAL